MTSFRRRRLDSTLAALLASTLSACTTLVGTSRYDDVPCVGIACASASDRDGGPDAPLDGPAADYVYPCDLAAAPARMANLGDYSIDVTEVTNEQYAVFLANAADRIDRQAARCRWNATFVPEEGWPPPILHDCDLPVVEVDWCDAEAYCSWAGKDLCGKPGGASVPYDDIAYDQPSQSEWFNACSSGGKYAYPYGEIHIAGRCVDDEFVGVTGIDATEAEDITGCHSSDAPFTAISNLSGNVAEWEDGCNSHNGAWDLCVARGGSYLDSQTETVCASARTMNRSTSAVDVGFRCCSL